MKKFLLSSAFIATIALLAACGDDSSSGPEEESSSSIAAEGESSSSEETSSSSNFTNTSSSQNAVASSSSNVIASSSGATQSSSSEESSSSSSSSVIASSSSAKQSSSSEAVTEVMPSGTYDCDVYKCVSTEHLNRDMLDTNGYGEILDTRDDQVYKVVTIGGQTWMAQNLNYALDEDFVKLYGSLNAWSGCYNGEEANCAKYGRLYTWAVAMDNAGCGYGSYCSNSYEGTQGVCPEGWHLPSSIEWQTLFSYVGNEVGSDYVGTALKTATGWYLQTGDVADGNAYGFSALPAGNRDDYGSFNLVGYEAYFWSSTERSSGRADNEYFYYGRSDVDENNLNKYYALSVRCLRDSN